MSQTDYDLSETLPAQTEKGGGASEDEGHSSGNGEDDSFGSKNSPLVLSKLISRSKGSLLVLISKNSVIRSVRKQNVTAFLDFRHRFKHPVKRLGEMKVLDQVH